MKFNAHMKPLLPISLIDSSCLTLSIGFFSSTSSFRGVLFSFAIARLSLTSINQLSFYPSLTVASFQSSRAVERQQGAIAASSLVILSSAKARKKKKVVKIPRRSFPPTRSTTCQRDYFFLLSGTPFFLLLLLFFIF